MTSMSGILIIALASMLTLSFTAQSATVEIEQTIIMVKVENNRLELEVKNASVGRVLKEIGKRAGFLVEIPRNFDTPISLSLSGMSIEKSLRRILRKTSYVTIYHGLQSEAAGRTVAKLCIIGSGGNNGDHYRGPTELILNKETKKAAKTPGNATAKEVDASARIAAIEILANLGTPETAVALINALNDPLPQVRNAALLALATSMPHTAIGPLEIVRATDKNPANRMLAGEIIYDMIGPKLQESTAPRD